MKRSGFIWCLLFCLLLVNGLTAAPSVGHAAHHSSHQAGTHGTSICAWLCAAGQGVETPGNSFAFALRLIGRTDDAFSERIPATTIFSAFLRGPPRLFS